jgi:hypothetical protein
MNRSLLVVALILILFFGVLCSKTPPAPSTRESAQTPSPAPSTPENALPPVPLTQESAQRTLEGWAKSKSFSGQITVENPKINEGMPGSVTAGANIKFNNFIYTVDGQQRTYSDTGLASFIQKDDGRWFLEDVQIFQISGNQYPAFHLGIEVK